MALFYQHSINAETKLAVWKIEEPEQYFAQRVSIMQEVSHPYKRLQHFAGRYLLPELFEDFPLAEIQIADTRKPFLAEDPFHFSIAHAGNFAAAIASRQLRVGIDLELVTPRMKAISPKFLNADEKSYLTEWNVIPSVYLEMLTAVWCAKEAMFKWYGKGQVDFRKHMFLTSAITYSANEWLKLPFFFGKDIHGNVDVYAKRFDGLMLAWVATSVG